MTLLPVTAPLKETLTPMPPRGKPGPHIREGAILRARREHLGLSQVDLAGIYQSSQTYISSVERGWESIQSASLDWIRRYATALQWSAEEMMNVLGIEHAKARGVTPISQTGRQVTDYLNSVYSASVQVLVNNTGNAGETPEVVTVVVNAQAGASNLRGLRMGHMYLNSVPNGMIALYDPSTSDAKLGGLVVVNIGGERHIAYVAADGYVETDRPINPLIPLRFRPDAIQGLVVQRVDDRLPERLN